MQGNQSSGETTTYDQALVQLRAAAPAGWIRTQDLDRILRAVWGNEYDASMCCNSMLRRGDIEYSSDGDWRVGHIP